MSRTATQSAAKGKGIVWVFLVLISCFLVFLMPTVFILAVAGMLPTVTAYFVERHGMGRVQVTAGMNMAGVIPFVGELWRGNGTFDELAMMAGDVFVWGTMYGSAGLAILLLWAGPHVASVYLEAKAARHVHTLERHKAKIIEEWGDIVDDNKGGDLEDE